MTSRPYDMGTSENSVIIQMENLSADNSNGNSHEYFQIIFKSWPNLIISIIIPFYMASIFRLHILSVSTRTKKTHTLTHSLTHSISRSLYLSLHARPYVRKANRHVHVIQFKMHSFRVSDLNWRLLHILSARISQERMHAVFFLPFQWEWKTILWYLSNN